MPRRVCNSLRMLSPQGSAPKMPRSSVVLAGSMPRRSISSTMLSMYDGVPMIMVALKSRINCTWRSVWPPEIGTTVMPSRSAP